MDAVQMLEHDIATEKRKVREIVDAADAEGRPVTAEERQVSQKALERITELKSRIADEKDKNELRNLVDGFDKLETSAIDANPVREPAVMSKARTMGDALVNSDGFRVWQAKARDAGKAPRFTTPAVNIPNWAIKAAGDPVLESDNTELFGTGGGAGVLRTLLGLETPGFVQPRLTIADLMTNVPVTVGNAVTYPIVKTRTQISGTPVTENTNKPGGEYEFDEVTEVLITLAGWIKVSVQFLEDAPGLAAYINSDLPLQIRQNEETYLASELYSDAAGTADGTEVSGDNGFDAILGAITTIQDNGGEPDGMIITPFDWATLRASKFEGGDGHYVGGGPFTATNNPWDLRVVVTPAATTGSPLVGDFRRGAKVYRKGGLNVDSTNSDGTDFIKNLITIRAEERLVEGTTYPEWFCTADIGTGS